uniref:Auxin-responsive protein n=1 Tax=Aegilops tauschii subsp. strangulata TaxID=200361 RepID=A0A453QU46_AEGTS
MELELGLAPPNHAGSCGKRGSAEAFGVNKPTLPLFLRDDDDGDHGNGEDGTGDARDWDTACRRKRLVGLPPVKIAHRPRSRGNGHVKVKMEGVPIGRKVDLSRHASYHQLHHTLRLMFPRSTSHHGDPYAVTYEDGDGDWMLIGDVPWEEFSKSAKRLKILM